MDGDFERSIVYFERALGLQPDFANARANLAQVYLDAGMLDQAEEALLHVRRHNPTGPVLGMVANRLALVRLLRKIAYQPNIVENHIALSEFHAGNNDLVKAAAAMAAAAELRPEDLEIQLRLAALYETLELVQQALAAYRTAAVLSPDDSRIEARVTALERLEVDRNARQEWLNRNEIILSEQQADSGHPETCSRARAQWTTCDFESTISEESLSRAAGLFEQSVRADAKDLHAYRDAARIYEALGDLAKAGGMLRQGVAAAPEDVALRRELRRVELLEDLERGNLGLTARKAVWLEVCHLYQARGDTELAIEAAKNSIEEAGGDSSSWAILAQAYSAAGKYKEAQETLEIALTQDTTEIGRDALEKRLSELQTIILGKGSG